MLSPSPSRRRLTRLCFCALLAALSILLGKYLAFNLGEFIRISFENLPVLVAGLYLGPLAGMAVGALADLVGCVLVGYAINPLITLGAVTIGLVAGCFSFRAKPSFPSLLTAVALSHLTGSVLVKTAGLVLFYQLPLLLTLGQRVLNYLLVGAAECALLWALARSKALTKELSKMNPPKGR